MLVFGALFHVAFDATVEVVVEIYCIVQGMDDATAGFIIRKKAIQAFEVPLFARCDRIREHGAYTHPLSVHFVVSELGFPVLKRIIVFPSRLIAIKRAFSEFKFDVFRCLLAFVVIAHDPKAQPPCFLVERELHLPHRSGSENIVSQRRIPLHLRPRCGRGFCDDVDIPPDTVGVHVGGKHFSDLDQVHLVHRKDVQAYVPHFPLGRRHLFPVDVKRGQLWGGAPQLNIAAFALVPLQGHARDALYGFCGVHVGEFFDLFGNQYVFDVV